MITTEAELRSQLRRPEYGAVVHTAPGASFTPAARDFVNQWRLVVVDDGLPAKAQPRFGRRSTAELVPAARQQLVPKLAPHAQGVRHCADAPKSAPEASALAGGQLRVLLRAKLESVRAMMVIAQGQAKAEHLDWLDSQLGTMLSYCFELSAAEASERTVPECTIETSSGARTNAVTTSTAGRPRIDGHSPVTQQWLNLVVALIGETQVLAELCLAQCSPAVAQSICAGLKSMTTNFYHCQRRLAEGSHEH